MSLRKTIVALWLGTVLCAVAPARAQDQDPVAPFVGKVVSAVRLEVEGRPEISPALLSLIDVKAGQPFTREGYLYSTRHLKRLAPYKSVQVQVQDAADGLVVVFIATPFHPVDTMQFIDDAQLNVERLVKERYGSLPLDLEPEILKGEIGRILAGEGYMHAAVTAETVESHNPCRATVVFHVTAGAPAVIGEVHFDVDNHSKLPDARLEADTGVAKDRPYRPRAINDALASVLSRLKNDGYYLATTTLEPTDETADHKFNVTIKVVVGPHVVLRWAKDSQPPSGDINEYVPIKQQNAIDKDTLDDSQKTIAQALKNKGYLEANATYEQDDTSQPGEMFVTYHVKRGPRYRIDQVEIPEDLALKRADIIKLLDLKAGDFLEFSRLSLGLQKIRNEYLKQGFYRITFDPKWPPAPNRPATSAEVRVVLRPNITEGPKGIITKASILRDTKSVPDENLLGLISGARGPVPYQAAADESEKYALEGLYLNLGYRQAKVTIQAIPSADGREITRVVHIVEGPLITVGDIRVVGFHDISEKAIREELSLFVGHPYGEAARLDSQRKISGMGVFRRVFVREDEPLLPGETTAHVVVTVVESPDTTIGYGGGLEVGEKLRTTAVDPVTGDPTATEDRLEFAPRGFMEVSRRNLGGRNRALSLFTRISLRPKDVPEVPELDGKGYAFSEYKVSLTYRERRAFGTDIDWVLGLTSEQSIRTSFNFVRNAANADFVRRLTERTTANLRYTLDFTRLYDVRYTPAEKLDVDRVFNQVRLSMLSLAVLTDHRDDRVSPTRGTFSTEEFDFALRGIGSEVGFTKMFLQSSAYRRVSTSPRSVVAVRGQLGVARGFKRPDPTTPGGIIADLPASQRFFAGGSTTIRGFSLDRVGVPGVLTPEGLPLGGNGLVVLNAELRTVVGKLFGRNFTAVQFADAGNVFAKASDMSLTRLRGSLGLGLRYDSPIGPLRLDVGFKLSRLDIGGKRERGWEYHLSFGEAF